MKIKLYAAIALCIFASFGAIAKGFAPVATPQPGGFKFKFASNGQPVANFGPVPGGVLGASGVAAVSLTPMVSVEALATGVITGAAAGGAWGAAAGALGVVAVAAIPAIKQWMDIAGVKVLPDGSLTQPNPNSCSANCVDYMAYTEFYRSTYNASKAGACNGLATVMSAAHSTSYVGVVNENNQCRITNVNGNFQANGSILTRQVAPSVAVPIPATREEAAAVMVLTPPSPAALQALLDANFPAPVSDIRIVEPTAKYIGNTVMLGLDGSTISETTTGVFTSFGDNLYVDLRKDFKKVFPNGLSTDSKQVTTTNPDGTTQTQTITTTTTTPGRTETGTYATPKPDAPAPTGCGLPGGPACKIDETGTETTVGTTYDAPKAELETAKAAAAASINSATQITAPSWSFSFQLPTGCAPYNTGIRNVIVNMCTYQSTIHDLMSLVWAAATAFCIIGMVGKTIRQA